MTRREQAERYAKALRSTTVRYNNGLMVKATWKKHMRALWRQVAGAGLQQRVQLELNRRERGRFSRRLDEIESCRKTSERRRQ